jgi:mercuric ion transport protein
VPTSSDRRFQWLPKSLTGLAGMACAACCLIPVLLAAGVIGGAGWSAIARALPAVAVTLAAVGGLLWWWLTHRKSPGCPADCGCSDHPVEVVAVSPIKT